MKSQVFISLLLMTGAAVVLSKPTRSGSLNLGRRHEDDFQILESRQKFSASGSVVTINTDGLLTPLFDYLKFLQTNKAPDGSVNVKDANASQTGVQVLQNSLTSLKADNDINRNGLSAIAVRFGKLQFPIAWDGVPGVDWGHNLITIDASDGTSLWDFYWVKSGKISVTTSNLTNDVAVGASELVNRDPTNPNVQIITILPASGLMRQFAEICKHAANRKRALMVARDIAEHAVRAVHKRDMSAMSRSVLF